VATALASSAEQAWIIQKPSVGRYAPDCLRLTERDRRPLDEGEIRVRTVYLSLDPSYLTQLRLGDAAYVVPLEVGDVMKGVILGVVEETRAPDFAPGDVVSALADWSTHPVLATGAGGPVPPTKILRQPGVPLSAYLTVFSHIGLVAMIGIGEIARPLAGETVLVSAAAGAVGTIAAQIAKAYGCRVIGIAGGEEKCRFLVEDLGLDGAIDYRTESVDKALGRLCPEGVDVYFDNVGGEMLDTVLLHLAQRARVLLCGEISQYDLPEGTPHYGLKNTFRLVLASARMEGFIPPAYVDRYEAMFAELGRLFMTGAVQHRSHVVAGMDQAATALALLLTGGNQGKLMVQVSDDPWN
jgi:NADPH-dependent curcumin reductase CurA